MNTLFMPRSPLSAFSTGFAEWRLLVPEVFWLMGTSLSGTGARYEPSRVVEMLIKDEVLTAVAS